MFPTFFSSEKSVFNICDTGYILTHWGRVTHMCVGNLTIIGSDNGLSPERPQAIIWTNAGILLLGPLGTNFNENLIEILTFSLKKMRLKVSSAKRQPFCLGINMWIRLYASLHFKHSLLQFCLTSSVNLIFCYSNFMLFHIPPPSCWFKMIFLWNSIWYLLFRVTLSPLTFVDIILSSSLFTLNFTLDPSGP